MNSLSIDEDFQVHWNDHNYSENLRNPEIGVLFNNVKQRYYPIKEFSSNDFKYTVPTVASDQCPPKISQRMINSESHFYDNDEESFGDGNKLYSEIPDYLRPNSVFCQTSRVENQEIWHQYHSELENNQPFFYDDWLHEMNNDVGICEQFVPSPSLFITVATENLFNQIVPDFQLPLDISNCEDVFLQEVPVSDVKTCDISPSISSNDFQNDFSDIPTYLSVNLNSSPQSPNLDNAVVPNIFSQSSSSLSGNLSQRNDFNLSPFVRSNALFHPGGEFEPSWFENDFSQHSDSDDSEIDRPIDSCSGYHTVPTWAIEE